MNNEKVLVIDFGGQYNQLIARRVREHNVYCEMYPHTISIEKIKELSPIGIIFTGGPNSVYADRVSTRRYSTSAYLCSAYATDVR